MKINSKSLGKLTGKVVATTKTLPKKTTETSKSLKDEFLAGFAETNGVSKGEGRQTRAQESDNSQQ